MTPVLVIGAGASSAAPYAIESLAYPDSRHRRILRWRHHILRSSP
ncbi:MAG TPA: hypothetical protein VFX33_08370 [Actinomycetales bacterium]|jgi:hypothetical protein|nr:hypothetical protein [Actinomycetales bacterium]